MSANAKPIVAVMLASLALLVAAPDVRAQPGVSDPISIVNIIPNTSSDDVNQNSEPTVAADPKDPKILVANAFANNLANPTFYSKDGASTWTIPETPIHQDASLAYGANSNVYRVVLAPNDTGANSIQVARQNSTGVANGNGFANLGNLKVMGTKLDQPWIAAGNVGGKDNVYVGYNDGFGGGPTNPGNTAKLQFSLNAGAGAPTWNNVNPVLLESRNPTSGDGPAIRIAAAGNTVYAAYESLGNNTRANGTGDYNGIVVVTRSDNGGVNGFTKLSTTGGGVVNGVPIAGNGTVVTPPGNGGTPTTVVLPFGAAPTNTNGTFLGTSSGERLGSDLSIAVDPNHPNRVFVAYAEVKNNIPQVDVWRSTNFGQSWGNKPVEVITNAALPAIAVSPVLGVVGLLVTEQASAGGHDMLQTHLIRSTNDFGANAGGYTTDRTLAQFTVQAPGSTGTMVDPGRAFDPFIGDYQQLVAVGNSFVGIFSSSNLPDAGNFPDPFETVKYQRNVEAADGTLLKGVPDVKMLAPGAILVSNDGTTPVNTSIDPFVFTAFAIPEPSSIVLMALGGTSILTTLRGRRGIRPRGAGSRRQG